MLDVQINRLRLWNRRRRAETHRTRAMARPFDASAREKLLLVTQPERIPQSQIFPFHHYAADFERLYHAQIREADVWQVLDGLDPVARGASVVAFQTPFDIADDALHRLIERLRALNPGARLVCLDWFAPTDLRNAARMHPLVDLYVKKHVLRDRSRYGQPTLGDTNLTDHYNRAFGLSEPESCWPVPAGFMDKLLVGPSFATAPMILPGLTAPCPPQSGRPLDIHARFELNGTPWYQGMRRQADEALNTLPSARIARGQGVPLPRFMVEMRQSKIGFSPFGYGEVCWRDYEGIMAGAVLLKQDMSHIETNPDIFVAWETYAPVAWDMSDFAEVTGRLLDDPALRTRLARQAHAVLHRYLRSDAFARQMGPLFG